MTAVADAQRRLVHRAGPRGRPSGLAWVLASEAFAGGIGFVALVIQARRLGPAGFARFEYAAAVAAWMLVVVRGGVDVIVYREAARRPRLIARLTDLLFGLRLAAAIAGYSVVLVIAGLAGSERGLPVAVAGLVLVASAFTADVGLRAEGRLRWLAAAQCLRALAYVAAITWLVRGTSDATLAAWGLVVAESVAAAITFVPHAAQWGVPRPRFGRRACGVLLCRGAIAGLTRFGRVTLYGADMLALGAWVGPELGAYAAGRRVTFAFVALGLVIPAMLGPAIARAWAEGTIRARALVATALEGLLALSIPAALGLALTADRWTPLLFGAAYHDAGPWLALVCSRLPFLLAASFVQAVLVACRREGGALAHVLGMLGLAAVAIPIGLTAAGPWGVGWAVLAFEAVGAAVGWGMLMRLGVAPAGATAFTPVAAGCVGLVAMCRLTGRAPLAFCCAAAAVSYGALWRVVGSVLSIRSLRRGRQP